MKYKAFLLILLHQYKAIRQTDMGLYDMAGNVWEWCADLYHEDYYKTLANKTTHNPK